MLWSIGADQLCLDLPFLRNYPLVPYYCTVVLSFPQNIEKKGLINLLKSQLSDIFISGEGTMNFELYLMLC